VAATDHLWDHVAGALVTGLRTALGLAADRCHVGWPAPGQGPEAGPLPALSVTLASAQVALRRAIRVASVEGAVPAEAVATYQIGQGTATLQVDLWAPSKTARLALAGAVRDYLVGRPSTGLTGRILTLDRLSERARYTAGQTTYDDDDGAGPRALLPVSVRVPYLVRETLARAQKLVIESQRPAGSPPLPGLGPETRIIFAP
jgi:hypothetical protein